MRQQPDDFQRSREDEEHEKDLVTFRLGSRRRFRATLILGAAAITGAFLHVSEARPVVAIGVTLGGLLLDVVVPRPKPRVGHPLDPSLHSERPGARTARYGGAGATQSPAEAKRGR